MRFSRRAVAMTSTTTAGGDATASETIETTRIFRPQFGEDGLVPAVVTDARSGEALMFAYMNEEALAATIGSGFAHFWSRSRGKLWKKGEESGNLLRVVEIRTDCDQDVIWIRANVLGAGVACHTGSRSCFYRRVVQPDRASGGILEFVEPLRPERSSD
jgi:phosphoribosyl-AMP cyclohydrolase